MSRELTIGPIRIRDMRYDGGRQLAEIAGETGFSDQSHMTRAIAKATGLTPAALRRMARG